MGPTPPVPLPAGPSSGAARRVAGLAPGAPLAGVLRPPPSKSLALRALLAAALARGSTRLGPLVAQPAGAGGAEGPLEPAADLAAALAWLAACGIRFERVGADVVLEGRPPDAGGWRGVAASVGESATLARLAAAVCALDAAPGERSELRAEGTLRTRASAPLLAALRAAGARVETPGPGPWPLVVHAGPDCAALELAGAVSSQELSALLLAGAARAGERTIAVRGPVPSRPYVTLTAAVLERFGARLAREELPGPEAGELWRVRGPLLAPAARLALEPDASAAAVALAAAALSGGEVLVPGLGADALQGDVAVVGLLARFGVAAQARPDGLVARGRPDRAATLDLAGHPDLAPVLAPVAAAAALAGGGTSVLAGLGALPRKESDRLAGLAHGLAALGFAARAEEGRLTIGPPPGRDRGRDDGRDGGRDGGREGTRGARLDPRGDHRMAFAFALLGLVVEGVWVEDAGCVAKSWPRFWEDLRALGARVLGP